jgi:hypothetical protein
MLPRCWPALLLAAGCGAQVGSAAQADEAPRDVLALLDAQLLVVPDDAPDDLVEVPDRQHLGRSASLRDADVIGAWTTAASPSGEPSAAVFRCAPGVRVWSAAADGWLAPLGVDPASLAELAPFTARVTGSAFALDTSVAFGGGAPAPLHARLVVVEDALDPSADPADLPLARLRKTGGHRVGPFAAGSFEQADYVLRLGTAGGDGPAVGSPCTAGDTPQRVAFDAVYYFLRMPDGG